MVTLSERLKNELTELGASLIGFADLRDIPENQREGFNYGISIAVAINPAIVNGIGNGPTKEYYDEVYRLNSLLDSLDIKAAEIIKSEGYDALPKNRPNVKIDYTNRSTILPHKTVATRAGLGWIGKCALLVTEKFGSAIRISSVLTNAHLKIETPINQSNCGTCGNCVRNCPGEALTGDLWFAGKEREDFYSIEACRNKAIERTWKVSPGETHCGLCVLVCPHTKKYISSSGIDYSFPSVDVAENGDLEEILSLQKLAYQENARRYNDYKISPLMDTIEDLKKESKSKIILKVVQDRKIVGSVRAYEKDGTCFIGKLIVHPDYQNRGIGKKLVEAIEKCFRGVRYELFTGHLDEKNLMFYGKLGYKIFKTESVSEELKFVYMEK